MKVFFLRVCVCTLCSPGLVHRFLGDGAGDYWLKPKDQLKVYEW